VKCAAFVSVFIGLFAIGACAPRLQVPNGVPVSCDAAAPACPGDLVCVASIGRCLDTNSPCVQQDGDAIIPAPDGLACRIDGVDRAVCVTGLCTRSQCGDGRADVVVGEVCDDGAANRDGYAPIPGCRTDCSGAAPACGDGIVNAEEACDDGFRDGCGTCNADCSDAGSGAVCGDGVVCAELEPCDDGRETEACNVNCTLSRCGDGVKNASAAEVCDDGGRNSDAYDASPHCDARCAGFGPACGDGTTDVEEECDDGGQSGQCERSCQIPVCGDGLANAAAGEACDTGAASRTCEADCQPRGWASLGRNHTCVVGDDGAVRCFGDNALGQCGAGNRAVVGASLETMGENLVPLPTSGPVVSVVAGRASTCALLDDGRVECFGDNSQGSRGAGAPEVDVGGVATRLVGGADHVCALRDDGRVVCWGDNTSCQLGAGHSLAAVGTTDTDMGAALVPVALGASPVRALWAGDRFTCALLGGTADGRLKCWGENTDGQLGLGDDVDRGCDARELGDALPVVDLPALVASVSLGTATACAHLRTELVVCWGRNTGGALGQGLDETFSRGAVAMDMGVFMPATPLGAGPVLRLTRGGGDHFCAVRTGGAATCWGKNSSGQLGLEDSTDRGLRLTDLGDALPRVNLGDRAVVDIAAGPSRTCALMADGSLRCFGDHAAGATIAGLGRPFAFPLGDAPGEMGNALAAVPLQATCGNAIVESGEACDDGFSDACGSCNADCTDAGTGAVCGDGTLCAELEVCEPAPGNECSDDCQPCPDSSCEPRCSADICGDGVVCEGTEVCDPASVVHNDTAGCAADCAGITPELVAGVGGACLLDNAGRVRCFGDLADEQLGRFTLAAVGAVPGDLVDLEAVALGQHRRTQRLARSNSGRHSCALLSDGTVKCWGSNRSGQLGTGDLLTRGQTAVLMGDALPSVDLGTGFVPTALGLGGAHSCALSTQGFLKCWGDNRAGQLGQGSIAARLGGSPTELGDALPPVRIPGVVTGFGTGTAHTCVVTAAGEVYCFGEGAGGRLGVGSVTTRGLDPAGLGADLVAVRLGSVDGAGGTQRRATKVSVGVATSCALLEPATTPDSGLKCWGDNAGGLVGAGLAGSGNSAFIGDTSVDSGNGLGSRPTELDDALTAVDFGGPGALDVCLGATFACALLDTDAVRCWGRGELGELGFADLGPGAAIGDVVGEIAAFPDVPLVTGADAITCGQTSACARLIDGRYSCWGDNRSGALGLERADDVVASVGGAPLDTLPLSP